MDVNAIRIPKAFSFVICVITTINKKRPVEMLQLPLNIQK